MNRHDPIFACICFQAALQVSAVLRMVGKTGKLQKFRYSEAGVAKHKGRICPRETAVGKAGQLSNLEIIQCVAGPLCAYGRNIQILGIVLIFRSAKRETRLFQAALWLAIEARFSLRYSLADHASNTSATI